MATNGIVDGNFKYVEYLDDHRRFLFDLATDPHETRNLLKSKRGFASDYHALIERWLPVVDFQAHAITTR